MTTAVRPKQYLGQIVFGNGGQGKTTYCLAAAQHVGWERTLWVHTERPIKQYDVPLWTPEKPYGVINAQTENIETVLKHFEKAAVMAQKGQWMYDLYVFDGISEEDLVNFADVEANTPRARDKRQLWGAQFDDLLRLVWTLSPGAREPKRYGLGAHVILTARVREVDDPVTPTDDKGNPITRLVPAVRGQFGGNIDCYYDQVLYIERRGGSRLLYLKPTGRIHVKNIYEHVKGVPGVMNIPDLSSGKNAFAEMARVHGIEL